MDCIVVTVVNERIDGAGEEKVESAGAVDWPAAVAAVFAPTERAVARSVATVGAAEVP